MTTKKEIAWDLEGVTSAATVAHSETRAVNDYQALMECPPGVEPERSLETLAPLREVIVDAMQSVLTEREQWVFDASFSRKIPLRKIGAELSLCHTHVRRIREQAKAKLIVALQAHPLVREHLRD